jgi:LacI family transcriptional regulator
MKRPTLNAIAAAVGVSVPTVSRALRGHARVDPVTRSRVEAAARQLGYLMTPAAARGASGASSTAVGVVLGPLENPYFSWMLTELAGQLVERGKQLVFLTPQDLLGGTALPGLAGCIITTANLQSRMANIFHDHGIPAVMINRSAEDRTASVLCDNEAGAGRLAELVLRSGHRRIALVSWEARTSAIRDRERGFIDRLAEADAPPAQLILVGRQNLESSLYADGEEAARLILQMPRARRPELVFALADVIALGIIDTFRRHGTAVPDDISVVGFDGIPEGERFPYRLTTLRQPMEAMVRTALDLMLTEPAGLAGRTVLLQGDLLERSSVGLAGDGSRRP